jgi:hypothetical protein
MSILRLVTLVFVLPTVVLAVRRKISDEDLELDVGKDVASAGRWHPFRRKKRVPKTTRTTTTTYVEELEDEGVEEQAAPRSRPARDRVAREPANPSLPECLELASFTTSYTDEDTGETYFHGQCELSTSPGAYFSNTVGEPWSCWSEDTPSDLLNDGSARDYGFDGACNFGDWYKALTVKDVPACDHVPIDCSPGASWFVGACYSADSEAWLCIQRPDQVEDEEQQQEVFEQFAAGDCKATAIRESANGKMYDGACHFEDKKQDVYKCDTVEATYEDGNAGTCGGGDYESACFSVVPGVVWQCFPEHLENELCSSTPSSDGLYTGACVFYTADQYDDAKDASKLQVREPSALLQQSDEIWPWSRRAATTTAKWKKSTTTSTTTSTTSPRATGDGDDDEDPFHIPGIADEPRARRQPSQPLNPSLPECTDLPSFKHSYSDEETEELVFHGQCDISASPGAYFSSSGDEEWSCWSEETPAELRNDAHAIEAGFVGACNFGEWYMALGPEDAETCDRVPVDCSPGGSVFWGACHTALSDEWLCIQRPDQVKHEEEQERVVEQFAGGACKALAIRDDTEGNMYAGVCAFKNEEQELFKCDTVDATYEDGNAGTCGGGDFDSACFSLVPGVIWQCFPETLDNPGCASTPSSDGMYEGACLFPGAEGYAEARNANALQQKAPSA